MFEHLMNCHGEFNLLYSIIGTFTFLAAWANFYFSKLKKLVFKTKKQKSTETKINTE